MSLATAPSRIPSQSLALKQEKHNSIKLLTKTKLDRVMEAITDNPTDIKAFHQLSFLKDGKESEKKLEVKRRHLKTEKKSKRDYKEAERRAPWAKHQKRWRFLKEACRRLRYRLVSVLGVVISTYRNNLNLMTSGFMVYKDYETELKIFFPIYKVNNGT